MLQQEQIQQEDTRSQSTWTAAQAEQPRTHAIRRQRKRRHLAAACLPFEIYMAAARPALRRWQKRRHLVAAAKVTEQPRTLWKDRREVDELLAVLRQESYKRKTKRRVMRAIGGTLIVFMVTMLSLYLYRGIATGKWSDDFPFYLWVSGLGSCFGAMAFSEAHTKAAKQLAQHEDLRAVGPLAEVLETKDQDVHDEAKSALMKLLPQMKASDAGVLNADQREALYRVLTGALRQKDLDLTIQVLSALEQVGDSKAIPYVQKLVDAQLPGPEGHQVMEAAQALLPTLQAREEAERDQQGLLRPSAANQTPAELLRPAEGAQTTQVMELLRAYADFDAQAPRQDADLAVTILNDLGYRRDAAALPYVEQIARMPSLDPRIRAAAEECLPKLQRVEI